MKFLATLLLPAILVLASAPAALAAPGSQDQAFVGLHIIPQPAKGEICAVAPAGGFGCDAPWGAPGVTETGNLGTAYYMYIVLLDLHPGPGVAGFAFGIDYEAVDGYPATSGIYLEGTKCSDLEFPDANWPDNPPAGITLTWDPGSNCQQTVDPSDPQGQAYAIAYGFYVYAYSEGIVQFIKRPGISVPDFKIADCTSAESNPSVLYQTGYAGFGTVGYPPCYIVDPVETTTWGAVKRAFGGE